MSLRKRSAFTLVELLVVISIIGMLMALILPAINAAKERGRAVTCQNNIRNLGLALIQYESTKKGYPGYLNVFVNSAGQPANDVGTSTRRGVSWVVPILSYLERNDLTTAWQQNSVQTPPSNTNSLSHMVRLDFLMCPSDPAPEVGGTYLSYVVNSGCQDATTGITSAVSRDSQYNGVFHDKYTDDPRINTTPATRGLVVNVSNDTISRGDGVVNTLLLSENIDAGSYARDTSEARLGMIWDYTATPTSTSDPPTAVLSANADIKKINGQAGQAEATWSSTAGGTAVITTTPTAQQYAYARPSSSHGGTVHAVFADSHTRAINDSIDYYTYVSLMTPSGTNVKTPGTANNLNSSSVNWGVPFNEKWLDQ